MEKLTDILRMGEYGAYVWPSFGAAALIISVLVITSVRSLTRTQRQLDSLQKADSPKS